MNLRNFYLEFCGVCKMFTGAIKSASILLAYSENFVGLCYWLQQSHITICINMQITCIDTYTQTLMFFSASPVEITDIYIQRNFNAVNLSLERDYRGKKLRDGKTLGHGTWDNQFKPTHQWREIRQWAYSTAFIKMHLHRTLTLFHIQRMKSHSAFFFSVTELYMYIIWMICV